MTLLTLDTSFFVSGSTLSLSLLPNWEQLQQGLTLQDLNLAVAVLLLVRLVWLALEYNLQTSLLITGIGLVAGYLWYQHFLTTLTSYQTIVSKLPVYSWLAYELRPPKVDLDKLMGNPPAVDWRNPLASFSQVVYSAVAQGVRHQTASNPTSYYMDPLSMMVSALPTSWQERITPVYYQLYQDWLPKLWKMAGNFWNQFSGIALYILLTRLGKRYCPYLIRWHWTFLILLGMVEQLLMPLVYRINYYTLVVLQASAQGLSATATDQIRLESTFLQSLMLFLVFGHLSFILWAMLHAFSGQYFYIPFLVENTELHTGPRPVNSIYSGGQTAWQTPAERQRRAQGKFPKLWYGWLGRGTKGNRRRAATLSHLWKRLRRWFQQLWSR